GDSAEMARRKTRRCGGRGVATSRAHARSSRQGREAVSVRYLLTRLFIGIGVMWGVVTLVFLLLRVAPGDPARLILGPSATAEQVESQRHQLGLDRPVAEQYGAWLSRVVRGDLGTSIATGRPVGTMLAEAWPA